MIKRIISFMAIFGLCSIVYANTIKFENLDYRKKEVFNVIDEYRKISLRNAVFETSNLMDSSNNKTSGENFLDIMENKEQKHNIELNLYTLCSKNVCTVKNNYNLYFKEYIEANPLDIGPAISYSFTKINDAKLNGANIGVGVKFNLDDYNLILNAKQEFRYTNINFDDSVKLNYYALNGAINAKFLFKKKINIVPELRLSYDYGIKSQFEDRNADLIKLKNAVDFSVGIGLNLEYEFGDKTKVKVGGGYAFDKEFYNKNKYEIFSHKLEKDKFDDMNHTGKIYAVVGINNKHNIKILLDYKSKMFGCSISYGHNW